MSDPHNQLTEKYLQTIIPLMASFANDTTNFNQIHFRNSLRPYLAVIASAYVTIVVAGAATNVVMIRRIVKRRKVLCEPHRLVFDLLLGNCFNDILVKCFFVLPISFLVLMTIHWTLGPSMCFTFPLLQDSCFNATSLTFITAFFFRYKMLSAANFTISSLEVTYQQHEFGAIYGLVISWLISIIGVIPHTIYIEFIDLSILFGIQFKSVGFCVINLEGNIGQYIRILFMLFYVVPIGVSLSIHYKTVDVIKSWSNSLSRSTRGSYQASELDFILESTFVGSSFSSHCSRPRRSVSSRDEVTASGVCVPRVADHHEPQLTSDLFLEKKIQSLLFLMFSIHSVCLLPLHILRFSKHLVVETQEKSFAFDMIFVVAVAFQFLSVLLVPVAFMVTKPKDCLLGNDEVPAFSFLIEDQQQLRQQPLELMRFDINQETPRTDR